MNTENQSQDTTSVSILKGINHLQNAIQYFGDARTTLASSTKAKELFKQILNRLQWAERELSIKMKSTETWKQLKQERENSATIDSLNNIVLSLPHMFREQVEEHAQQLHDEYHAFKKEFGHLPPEEIEAQLKRLKEEYTD